jgi:NADPH-dependent curcumin reductase CurA
MSNMARYEWHDQQAAVSERMKVFLENPGNDEMDAVVAQMREYAAAARAGSIEIPQYWTSIS